MTTIVYDHKSKLIAIDSRCTAGGLIVSDENIKYKQKDGKIFFFCGATADQNNLMELSHDDKPDVEPDCSALMVEDSVVYLVSFNNGYLSSGELSHSRSIGSGSDFGLAALDFGSTAKEAVEYAITKDCYSGGKVLVYDVNNSKFI